MSLQANPIVREATVAERSEIVEIFRASYSEYALESDPGFWSLYQASSRETLLNDESVQRIVVEIDHKIVGSVLICQPNNRKFGKAEFQNPYPEVRLLGILPECRSTGIASLLINECEDRIKSAGYAAITLHTTVLMQTAKAMYERCGYVRFAEIDFDPVPGFTVWGYIKYFSK